MPDVPRDEAATKHERILEYIKGLKVGARL